MNLRGRLATGALAAVVFGVCAGANAAPIVVFNFNDLNGTADALEAGLTSTAFTSGLGLTQESFATGAASARGWNPSNDAANAEQEGNYWTFTLSAQPGYAFDVDSLSLDEKRANSGPTLFQSVRRHRSHRIRRIDEQPRLHASRDCGAGDRRHRAGGSHPGVERVEQRRPRRLVRGQCDRQRQRQAAGHAGREGSRAGEPPAVRHRAPAGRKTRPQAVLALRDTRF